MPNIAPRPSAAETPRRSAARPPGRKTQLLRLASELFASKGYPNVSVAEIAAAASVTAPSIYRHFPDKQTILGEAVLEAISRLEEVSTPELDIDEFVIEMASAAVARPDLAVLWRWGVMHLDDQWRSKIHARSRGLLERWTTRIRMLRPELRPDEAGLIGRAMAYAGSSAIVRPGRLSSTKHAGALAGVVRRIVHAPLPKQPPERGDEIVRAGQGEQPDSNRREQLLAAASEMFLSRGFTAVGVDELGAAVGITGPSVYRHFSDKQAILAAVCLRGVRRLSDRIEAELAKLPEDTPQGRLCALIRAHASALLCSPDLVVAGTVRGELVGPAGQEARDFLRGHVARFTTALLQLDEESSPAEARVLVHAALTLANDLARGHATKDRPNLEAEIAALMAAAVGLGPD